MVGERRVWDGPRSVGMWQARQSPAGLTEQCVESDGKAATTSLPPGTTTYYLNLIDDRGLVVSTEHVATERPTE